MMNEKPPKSSYFFLVLSAALPFTISAITFYALVSYQEVILNFDYWSWCIVYFCIAFTMALALTPTTYIALASGYFIGWYGLAGIIPSYLLASALGYLFTSYIDGGKLLNHYIRRQSVASFITNLKKNEFWMIVFCRISPVLPFAMTNILLAFLGTNFKNYIIASTIGMLPRTILSIWVGTQAASLVTVLSGKEKPETLTIIVFILILLSTSGLYYIFKKSIQPR